MMHPTQFASLGKQNKLFFELDVNMNLNIYYYIFNTYLGFGLE